MAVYTYYYYGQPGLNYVQDTALAYVQVLEVARGTDVMTYNPSLSIDPENQEFLYDMGIGKIIFDPDNPFGGDIDDISTWRGLP